jgi:spermidine/putrescine transport system substrate-binding protein
MKKDINAISPEARAIIRAQVSRRSVLAGVGAVSAAGLLAACSSGSDSADVGTVRWANWTEYLDYDEDTQENPTLVEFEKQTGIKVSHKETVLDNDEFTAPLLEKLQSKKDIGYDLVTLTDWMTARWIRLGYTQKFNSTELPNRANVLDSLKNPSFDPGREQSIPWQGIMAGIGWNKEKIPGGIKSLDQLFAPANKGKVLALTEMRDTMGVIMLYQGVDPSKPFTEDKFMNAIDFLEKKIKDGFIIGFRGNEYTQDLRAGNATAVIGWSGDMFQLAAESDGKFDFAIPESGGCISTDNFMIPSTSINADNASKMVNYYYDPTVAATVAAWVNYICPVKGAQEAMEKVDPSLANSEYIFPTEKTTSRLSIFRALSAVEETSYQTAFQSAAGNA